MRGKRSPGGKGVSLYRAYQERLRTLNACDFGDLLLHTLTIFSENSDVPRRTSSALQISSRRRVPGTPTSLNICG